MGYDQDSYVHARRFAAQVVAEIRSWRREFTTPFDCPLRRLTDSSQLIPANRQGLVVARWLTESRTDELRLQIFQEVLVEPGLIEAILLSIIMLQSGHTFGDTQQEIASRGPKYYGPNISVLSTPLV
jgi:hypothetical protein